MPSILSTVASSRTTDSIFEELSETIGFDNIELVMEILQNRDAAIKEVSIQRLVTFARC